MQLKNIKFYLENKLPLGEVFKDSSDFAKSVSILTTEELKSLKKLLVLDNELNLLQILEKELESRK